MDKIVQNKFHTNRLKQLRSYTTYWGLGVHVIPIPCNLECSKGTAQKYIKHT